MVKVGKSYSKDDIHDANCLADGGVILSVEDAENWKNFVQKDPVSGLWTCLACQNPDVAFKNHRGDVVKRHLQQVHTPHQKLKCAYGKPFKNKYSLHWHSTIGNCPARTTLSPQAQTHNF